MKIIIGADHRGFHFKLAIQEQIRKVVGGELIEWLDVGCFTAERCDYPEYAYKVAVELKAGNADLGILICGSGIGMSIAANRIPGIYAGLAWNETSAHLAREHDGVNVLVMPADFISIHDAVAMIHAWLNASFKGGRYADRLKMLEDFAEKARQELV